MFLYGIPVMFHTGRRFHSPVLKALGQFNVLYLDEMYNNVRNWCFRNNHLNKTALSN